MTIESVIGTLTEVYKLLRPESILHADELMKERRTNIELRNQSFYTADGEVYSLQGEDRTPTLAITRGSSNPLFQDSKIDNYCPQLFNNRNYRPTPDETLRALQAEDTVLVDLTTLRLQKYDEEFSYLAINTEKYKTLNSEEQKLAQRVYGKDDDFAQTIQMLAGAGIRETKVYVLNPDYVRKHIKEGSLGRASWLNGFYGSSIFYADDRSVVNHYHARGVRRENVACSSLSCNG